MYKGLPINGITSDVSGSFSPMLKLNTEYAKSMVKPSVIFSPLSVGRQNCIMVNMESIVHGIIML